MIADFVGDVGDPAHLAARLESTPGVVEHGLFPPEMVSTILVGRGRSVERIDVNPVDLRRPDVRSRDEIDGTRPPNDLSLPTRRRG